MALLQLIRGSVVGKTILALVITDWILIGLGLILTPSTIGASIQGPLGVAGALTALGGLGILGMVGSRTAGKKMPQVVETGAVFGLAIGFLFIVEMLYEYIALPGSEGNARLGHLEFGGMLFLLFLSGVQSGRESGAARDGVHRAVCASVIGSLIWAASLLTTYYIFLGSARQDQVLAADQVLEDFKRSGMTDLRAFVMQDYLGGIFFHSLLCLVAAVVLGMVGSFAGRLVARWSR
jgi:hypothetical protein